ncbi:calcineurin [Perkinsus olseni]|uniref:Calcineurin n=1 Tax=Perkinsus olseni TaxID=32597 RepID=A0A7J6MC85_PEROL|nr:calcineurin [Perkinsus olseni]KAF4674584.1 calcineurin [Perkinsus olseni]
MGGSQSISKSEMHSIASFTEQDIRRLYSRFQALDKDGNGQLDPSELLGVREISENPLVRRVVSIFDVDGNGTVSFIEFLVGLARVAVGSDEEEKLKFAFEVYDVDKDGYISNGDLFQVMKMMVGDNLADEQLQQLVDRTMRDTDKNMDGKLSFLEFKAAVENIKVAEQLAVDI